MKKFFENKPRAWFVIGAVLVLLATAGTVAYLFLNKEKTDPNVLATVGDEKITQESLDEQLYGMGFLDDISIYTESEKNQLLSYLIEKSIIGQKAEELGITTTQKEIDDAVATFMESAPGKKDGATVIAGYSEKQKTITYENLKFKILKPKVQEAALAWNQGKFLVFRFDRYNKDLPEGYVFATTSEQDYQTKKTTLKELALEKADLYAERLKTGEAFLKVRDAAALDNEIGYPAIKPQTPFLSGVVSKNDYFSDQVNLNLPGFNSFNDKLAEVAEGEISDPFLFNDNNSKQVDYYVVYLSESKHSGYKWGYSAWLKNEKERLLDKKTAKIPGSLANLMVGRAEAAFGTACNPTPTHFYRFSINTVYQNRSSVDVYLSDIPLTIHTGWSNAFCNGTTYQGYYRTDTTVNNHEYITDSSGGSLSVGVGGADDLATKGYVDCNQTTRFTIIGPVAPVTISGADGGSWTVENGIPANSYVISAAPNENIVCLNNNTTDCGTVGSTAWANGSTGYHTYRYYPNWISNYTLTVNINPIGAATATGAGPYTANASATAGYTNKSDEYDFVNWSGDAGCGTTMTMNGNKSCTANFTRRLTNVSCSVNPATGLSPLVVRVIFSGGIPPYTIVTDGYTFANRTSPLYYTFGTAGAKSITVTDSNATTQDCTVNVTVNNQTNSDGGEVAP